VELLTGGDARCDSGRCTGRGCEEEDWKASWRQGGADARIGWGWDAVERLDHGRAEGAVRRSKAARVLGLGWRPRGGRMRVQGLGVLFVGRRLPSTCGPGMEGSPEISGARVRPVMRGKKKEEGERVLPGGVGESEREGKEHGLG
jgi:hypothetical protein